MFHGIFKFDTVFNCKIPGNSLKHGPGKIVKSSVILTQPQGGSISLKFGTTFDRITNVQGQRSKVKITA